MSKFADNEIRECLLSATELSELCSQNGWIDSDTVGYETKQRTENSLIISVQFEEILMEGAGCVAGRVSCYGTAELCYYNNKLTIISVNK